MQFFLFLAIILGIPAVGIAQSKPPKPFIDTAVKNIVSSHQVLLKNYAIFKGHADEMSGASAFLIHYRDKVYAVTARHVLGADMGVQPEIKIQELNKYMVKWLMFPRVPVHPRLDTIKIGFTKLNYDLLDKDILLLEIANKNFAIYPLTPDFNLPKQGDKLYIIGCPYSQGNCKQNIYEVTYERYEEETAMLNCSIKVHFELAGFSGAPIVNAKGNVVGVLTSGWEEGKTKFVGGTFIGAIQEIK